MKKYFLVSLVFALACLAMGANAAMQVNSISPAPVRVVAPAPVVQTVTVPAVAVPEIKPVDQLDPQPEPPAPVRTINGVDSASPAVKIQAIKAANQLNPQPEPPAPAKAGSVNNIKGEIEDIKSATQLNPQPEPPAPVINAGVIEAMVKSGKAKEMAPMSAPMTTPESIGAGQTGSDESKFSIDGQEIIVPILGKANFANGVLKIGAPNQEQQVIVKITPALFYGSLANELKNKNIGSGIIKKMELAIENNEPIYNVRIAEPAKLFGIIPINLDTTMRFSGDGRKVVAINRPWYAAIATKSPLQELELKPNLEITALDIKPSVYAQGATVSVVATIENKGPGMAIVSPPIWGYEALMRWYVDGQQIEAYVPVMVVEGGGKVEFDANAKVVCGKKVEVTLKGEVDGVPVDSSFEKEMQCSNPAAPAK